MAMYIKDTLKASISGNAGTATKLATARTITVGNTGKTFDGSGNVSWSLSEIGAAASSHTHNVLSVKSDNYKKNTDLPSTYERGETLFFINNPAEDGKFNGLTYGLVQTLKEYGSGPAAWQFLYPYNDGNQDKFYVRSAKYGTDSWRSWAQVYTSLNKPTPADIGAAATSHGTHVSYGGNGSATTVSRSDHTHSYLPLSGGNLTGSISLTTDNTGITGVCGGGTDQWTIVGGGTDDNGYLEIRTRDNGNEPIYVRQYDANGLVRTAALLDGNGATSFPGLISEGGTKLTDKYAAKSHGHNEIWVKDAPFSSSNDTTANWGGQGVSVSWYPDGTTITNKPNNWGFIFNIGRGTEVHQLWMTQATGALYHRGGNGSGWSGSWRQILDETNFSSFAAPASHSHSYLSTGGGTLSGPIQVSGESKFHNGTYSDPWSGTGCAIKATGHIAATGVIKANQYLQVGSCPLSIQSGAPSCGGVWIQI